MSFLKINGWEIPIASCRENLIDIGSRTRSHSGGLLSDIRAEKRTWSCSTTPMKEQDALALMGLLKGKGHCWNFEEEYYSSKGLAPSSANGIGYYPIKDSSDNPCALGTNSSYVITQKPGKFGSWAGVPIEDDVENICTANQRDSVHTAFAAVDGATLSTDTSVFLHNTQSVKCITSGAANAVRGGLYAETTGVATAKYFGSVWVYATVNTDVRIYLEDVTNVVSTTPRTHYIPANTWVRVKTGTGSYLSTGVATPTLRLHLLEDVADDGITIYTDGWQIETKEGARNDDTFTGSPFVDGTITGVANTFNINFLDKNDMSILFWSGAHDSWGEWDTHGLALYDSSGVSTTTPVGDGIKIIPTNGNADTFNAIMYKAGSIDDTLADQATEDSDGFCHWCLVLRQNPETGETAYTLYQNGVSGDTGNATSFPTVSNISTLKISNMGYVPLDDFMIVPYAMPADQILALYGLGLGVPQMPSFYISGDIIGDTTARCQAKDVKAAFTKAMFTNEDDTVTWHNNLRIVSFELLEV